MNRTGTLALACAALACASASAEVDWREMVQKCKGITDDGALAICIREGIAKQEAAEQVIQDAANAKAQKEANSVAFLLRESSSSIASTVGPKIGDGGASLSYLRDSLKNTDATVAKMAVFAVWPVPKSWASLQPFAGAAWQRDATKQPKKDTRELTAGMLGPFWATTTGPGTEATTLFTTFQATHRNDRYGTTDGDQLRAQLDWAYEPVSSGRLLGGLAVLPHVAGLVRHRSGGGPEDGVWRSAYAGVAMAKPVDIGQYRFKITWIARKLFDLKVPDGNVKRRDEYSNLSVEYFFTDPGDKNAPWQSSFFISRETGADFLEYGDKVAKTTAGLKLKFR